MKCLVDTQMVQTHHSDYVVSPNIYLDTKRYEVHTHGMHATCFDIQTQKYEVLEGGGMTSDGEHHGAKQFAVNLSENTCTCGVPHLLHVPYPHIIGMCNLLGQNFYVPPLWPPITLSRRWFALGLLVLSCFLDEEQWEPYDGPRYVADKVMMWKKRGPRRRTQYTMEMDRVKPRCSKGSEVNSESVEDRHKIRCSKCHKTDHN
jgi:hypothetical protein